MIRRMKYGAVTSDRPGISSLRPRTGIPGRPRTRSAAGSFVAYWLRIRRRPDSRSPDFERFLIPERGVAADIDIDFCERRPRRGASSTSPGSTAARRRQIITFGTMKARAVVRDVGRVLDVPFAEPIAWPS